MNGRRKRRRKGRRDEKEKNKRKEKEKMEERMEGEEIAKGWREMEARGRRRKEGRKGNKGGWQAGSSQACAALWQGHSITVAVGAL